LTGHGTITDVVIVLGIMIGVALVITFVVRSIVYSEHATGVIAPMAGLGNRIRLPPSRRADALFK
jgi:hypothetical protein